jgi:hypothetical protein
MLAALLPELLNNPFSIRRIVSLNLIAKCQISNRLSLRRRTQSCSHSRFSGFSEISAAITKVARWRHTGPLWRAS